MLFGVLFASMADFGAREGELAVLKKQSPIPHLHFQPDRECGRRFLTERLNLILTLHASDLRANVAMGHQQVSLVGSPASKDRPMLW
jgi:hypothetical protein